MLRKLDDLDNLLLALFAPFEIDLKQGDALRRHASPVADVGLRVRAVHSVGPGERERERERERGRERERAREREGWSGRGRGRARGRGRGGER